MIRDAMGRGAMRFAVVLLATMLAGPAAGADDYLGLLHAEHQAAAPSGTLKVVAPLLEMAEDDADHSVTCSCAVCIQTLVRSASPLDVVPDEGAYSAASDACPADSPYRPDIFRPPSV